MGSEIIVGIPKYVNEENILEFVQILDFYLKFENKKFIIDFSENKFFLASFSAILAGFLKLYLTNGNRVFIGKNFGNSKTREILEKNKFFETITGKNFYSYDIWDTTVPFKIYKHEDSEKDFVDYIESRFISKDLFPDMSAELKYEIIMSFSEIFVNAKEHSKSKFPHFSCGQFFPNDKKISFTFVDLGIGIYGSIKENFLKIVDKYPDIKHIKNSLDAIEWALKEGTTTKLGLSGGDGLPFIKNFIQVNKGILQIVSNNGFWEINCSNGCKYFKLPLSYNYGGTILNLIFRIDDNYYYLSSEGGY